MLMASVSLMARIRESIYGHLQVLLTKLVPLVHIKATALASMHNIWHPHHSHPALLGMITSVTLAAKLNLHSYSTQTTPYGMELAVDQPIPDCSFNNPPWFLKQLPSNTTDDIEMRMCSDETPLRNEDTPFEILELYVR